MSLLKKIFGKPEAKISSGPRRPPRVQIRPLHRISFHDKDRSSNAKLANISVGGMAVIHGNDPTWKAGTDLPGIIVIDKEEHAIQARIRHIGEVIAGCEFVGGENVKLKRAIETYLRVEILGLNLHQVAEAYLKPDPRGSTFWFTDGKQSEIFFVADAQGLVEFHMSFLGNYIEGGRGRPTRTGIVQEQIDEDPGHKSSAMLDMSTEMKSDMINLAITFVQNIERMPKEMRDLFAKELAQS